MLRWEERKFMGEAWYAYSGELMVGMVVKVSAAGEHHGMWSYNVTAVHTKFIAKGHGHVKSLPYARNALERAWRRWLDKARLHPTGEK